MQSRQAELCKKGNSLLGTPPKPKHTKRQSQNTIMTAPSDSFAGKVFVITGGSRGLGLALARRLAQERAKLAILARDQQGLVDAKSDLEKYSSALTTWVSDVLGMMWRARAGAKRMGRALHDRGDRDCTGRNRRSNQQRG